MNFEFDDHENMFFNEDLTINRLTPVLTEFFRLTARRGFSISSSDISEIERAHKSAIALTHDFFDRIKEQAKSRRQNLRKYKDIQVTSLGEDCFPRILTAQWGLRKFAKIGERSVPFDLATHPVLGTISIFKNNFNGYLSHNDLKYDPKTKYCTNEKYKILFNHEIGKHYSEHQFALLKEIYNNRLSTFYSLMDSQKNTVLVFHSTSPNRNTSHHIKSLWKSIENKWDTQNKLLICIKTWRQGEDMRETEPFSDHVHTLDIHYPIKNYIWFKPHFSYSKEGYLFEKTIINFIKERIDAFLN